MGFIGIDRRLREHWVYQDAEYLKVWLEMLFLARFAKESGTVMVEGQLVEMEYSWFIFGRIKWSERLGISERRLRTLMDKLADDKMISLVKRAPKFSIYCVTNFDKYRPSNDQQESLEQQGIEEPTDQQDDQQATSRRPASDQQATTKEQGINKVNKVNKVIKDYTENTVELTNHLIDLMQMNNPNVKIPASLDKWHDEMDKLERIDKYDYMQIRSIIDWCQQDSFWKGNILSVPKLREKIGTLVMQMQRPKGGNNGKVSSFARLQQMAREENEREASGGY